MSTRAISADAATPSELEIPYSSLEYRRQQMFPRLSSAEIRSLRRFARPMSFKAGELIFETGHVALGLFVLLHGRVRICSRDSFGRSTLVTEHEDGHFMAKMARLSGKPALIDGVALTDIETLVIEPDRLQSLPLSGSATTCLPASGRGVPDTLGSSANGSVQSPSAACAVQNF